MKKRYRFSYRLLSFLLFAISTSPCLAEEKGASSDDNSQAPIARKTHVRLGGITIAGGYAHYSGPYYYYSPYYFPGYSTYWLPSAYYWSPWYDMYSPYYDPGPYRSYPRGPGMGEVKLLSAHQEAEVYLNGAYAGIVQDLKSIWLEPGAYDLEVNGSDNLTFKKRIYVLSGKSVRITPDLLSECREVKP